MAELEQVILFDGVCALCDASVTFVLARDKDARFRFAPLQSDAARELLERSGALDRWGKLDGLILVDGGRVHEGSTAALRIARGLSWPWTWLGALGLVVPRAFRDAAYRFVAARRYRWFGRFDACQLPRPEHRGRFLG